MKKLLQRKVLAIFLVSIFLLSIVSTIVLALPGPPTGYPSLTGSLEGTCSIKQYNQDGTRTDIARNETIKEVSMLISQTDNEITALLAVWRTQDLRGEPFLIFSMWGYLGSNITRSNPYPYLTLVSVPGEGTDDGAYFKGRVRLYGNGTVRWVSGQLDLMVGSANLTVTQDRWARGSVKLYWYEGGPF